MTQIEKAIIQVEQLKEENKHKLGACAAQIAMEGHCKEEAYDEVLTVLKSFLKIPKNKKEKKEINVVCKDEFVKELISCLNLLIAKNKLDAWFFNDWSEDNICGCNKSIDKYLNKRIPGTWNIITISGNGTNVGQGVFYNKEYNLELRLSCYNEDEEFIDTYQII